MPIKTFREAGVGNDACEAWLGSLDPRFQVNGGFAGLFPIGRPMGNSIEIGENFGGGGEVRIKGVNA